MPYYLQACFVFNLECTFPLHLSAFSGSQWLSLDGWMRLFLFRFFRLDSRHRRVT